MVKSRIVADGDAALSRDAEEALRAGAGHVDEAFERQAAAFTWSSMIGTSVCTPVMPDGVLG